MSLRYLDEFMRLRCAPDLLYYRLFPNAKEVTESLGAWNAVRQHVLPRVPVLQDDPDVRVFCVGDGHQPRTAALFAMMSRWRCWSIDPNNRQRVLHIDRLWQRRKRVEDFLYQGDTEVKLVLIVCVHSHASLKASVASIRGGAYRYLVNMPCCVPPDLDMAPLLAYDDPAILSAKRRVEVYDLN